MADPYDPNGYGATAGASGGGNSLGDFFNRLLHGLTAQGGPIPQVDAQGNTIPGQFISPPPNASAAAAGNMAPTGGGNISDLYPGGSIPSWYAGGSAPVGSTGGGGSAAAPASATGQPNDLMSLLQAIMSKLSSSGGGYAPNYAAENITAQASAQNAETARLAQIAKEGHDNAADAIAQRDAAVAEGNMALAQQKDREAQVWAKRSADAADQQNVIAQQNANSNRQNADTNSRNANTTAANGMTGLFSAEGDQRAKQAANTINLTNILGQLSQAQGDLALKIASTPRNAIAGLLMGRGQSGGGAAAYAPSNLFGIDPGMIQNLIAQAQQQNTMAPSINPQDILAVLRNGANAAPTSLAPAAPADNSGSRVGASMGSPNPATANAQSAIAAFQSSLGGNNVGQQYS